MNTGIYLILHEDSHTVYVGSAAVSFKLRWSKHKHLLRLGKHPNAHLQSAWTKYGESTFNFLIAEECPPENCLAVEQRWLDTLLTNGTRLYNKCMTAGSTLGLTLSDDAKKKMSLARKGRKHSKETKLAIKSSRLAHFRTKQGEKTREAIRRANKGKRLSEKTKKLLSKIRMENPTIHVGDLYRGKNLTADHRQKVSDGLKRFYSSEAGEEYRRVISARQKGRKASEETRQKQREKLLGHEVSEETKRKISEARKKAHTRSRVSLVVEK